MTKHPNSFWGFEPEDWASVPDFLYLTDYRLEKKADANGEYDVAARTTNSRVNMHFFANEEEALSYAKAFREQSPVGAVFTKTNTPNEWVYLYDVSQYTYPPQQRSGGFTNLTASDVGGNPVHGPFRVYQNTQLGPQDDMGDADTSCWGYSEDHTNVNNALASAARAAAAALAEGDTTIYDLSVVDEHSRKVIATIKV